MAHRLDMERLKDELVAVFKQGNEKRARALVSQLAVGPRQARAVLEAMLEDKDALVRQAGAFGLGELGGAACARRLEQQLAIEEARADYDGESVVEVITQALGFIKESGARASLVRRLERVAGGKPDPADVTTLARALWRRRHPDLVPIVRRNLERLAALTPNSLYGLALLLEESPDELSAWVRDPRLPVELKTRVLTVLEEDVPDALLSTLPAFISVAHALVEAPVRPRSEAAYFCERLFSLLLLHWERLRVALSEEDLAELRNVARSLVAAPSNSLRAAVVLKLVGRSEDAAVLEAHRPVDPGLAKVFDDAARVLRGLRKN
jgi:hypothetical protein